MKRYETLVILHNPAQEEGLKEAIDLITTEINSHGGRVETVQKMDRKPFSRVASKKVNSGFYVNFICALPPEKTTDLSRHLSGLESVFRALITEAPPAKEALPA